jgi:hypothetical protein
VESNQEDVIVTPIARTIHLREARPPDLLARVYTAPGRTSTWAQVRCTTMGTRGVGIAKRAGRGGGGAIRTQVFTTSFKLGYVLSRFVQL